MTPRIAVLLVCVLSALALTGYGCGGCPDGTREYAGRCIPEASQDTPHNPYLPFEPPKSDDDVVVLPKPTEPPRDYNKVPDVDVVDIGDLEVFPVDTGEIPDDAVSVVVWVEGKPDNLVLPFRIEDPDGKQVYDLQRDLQNMAINDDFDFHYYPSGGLSMFLPNTPLIDFIPGPWNISVTSLYPGNRYDVRIFSKPPRPANKPNARLGVNVWLVGVDGLDDDGKETPDFANMIDVFKTFFLKAGIEIAPLEYVTVSPEEARTYAILDSFDEFHRMMTLSSRLTNEWPNIFLIKGFSEMSGVLGMAAHIPGPPGLQGGRYSGVAVAMEYFDHYPRTMGAVMAHELGHWLGLFHPTEGTGDYFDAIPDTPKCPSSSHDHNRDGLVDYAECASHGADNIMFWMISGDENFTIGPGGIHFSPQQIDVLNLNPIVQYAE